MALKPLGGSSVSGTVLFETLRDAPTPIRYTIDGLAPGRHGVHVHARSDCDATPFGGPAAPGHAGTLGPITADAAGHAEGVMVDTVLAGHFFYYGSAIVYDTADDLAPHPSGSRASRQVACGVAEMERESGHH